MTDVPGMFIIFVCMFMCQEAVKSASDRAALMWLASATVFNVAAGTARQIAWLGALVMVPSTFWLLRKRRGAKETGVVLWGLSFVAVLIFLDRFNSQPYSVPEHIIWGRITWGTFPHLAAQLIKMVLCLLLIILPMTVAWLPSARKLTQNGWLRIGGVLGVFVAFEFFAKAMGRMDTWLMPWLMYLLPEQSSLRPGMFGTPLEMPLWIRFAISLFVVAAAVIAVEQVLERRRSVKPPKRSAVCGVGRPGTSWNEVAWMSWTFFTQLCSVINALEGVFDVIQDRYMVGLVPAASYRAFEVVPGANRTQTSSRQHRHAGSIRRVFSCGDA